MITQPITIENGLVTIRPTANGIWLTQSQIADLFGVFTAAVSTNIALSAAHAAETETSSNDITSK